jgi:hypothetical protein
MTVSAAKIVDLVAEMSRDQAIDLVESWALARVAEAVVAAGYVTLEQIDEILQRPQPKAVTYENQT